jgi:hypothetical protein
MGQREQIYCNLDLLVYFQLCSKNCNMSKDPFNGLRYQNRGEGEKMCKQTATDTTYYNRHASQQQY